MQIINNTSETIIFEDLKYYFHPEEVCFFDIETTGFSAEHTKLYLIGCCTIKNNKLHIIQWFNDDGNSEASLIRSFMDYISNYKFLLHYNGDGFDKPYIEKKCATFGIKNKIPKLTNIDLYKKLKPFKNFLHFDNLKLKTVEQFIGISRDDKYTGGELIPVYNDYLKHHSKQAFDLLMLHNFEDLENLVQCFALLTLMNLTTGNFELTNLSVKDNNLCFFLMLPTSMPKRVVYSKKGIVISIYKTSVTVSVPIIEDTLKMFYDNPTEYYYLPAEDVAIHKSVATYVDKSFREQAKRENCYCNVQGIFVTQLDGNIATPYKKKYNDKESYVMLIDSFLENSELLHQYITFILNNII